MTGCRGLTVSASRVCPPGPPETLLPPSSPSLARESRSSGHSKGSSARAEQHEGWPLGEPSAAPCDDQLSSKLINHHFMPHQALCWSSQQGPLGEPMGSWLFCLAGWDFHKQGRFWQANKYVIRLCHWQQPAPPAKWWGSAQPGGQWMMAETCSGRWQLGDAGSGRNLPKVPSSFEGGMPPSSLTGPLQSCHRSRTSWHLSFKLQLPFIVQTAWVSSPIKFLDTGTESS